MSSRNEEALASSQDGDRVHQQRMLEVFAEAPNWRKYFSRMLAPFVRGDVLEVGAGLGANTFGLAGLVRQSWTCLEPDAALAAETERALLKGSPALKATIIVGTIEDLPQSQRFDAVVYLDVLEHIEEDAEQLRWAAEHLKPGGRIVVLSPAHQWLFSPFDEALGHMRRYDRRSLQQIAPPGLICEKLAYLDSLSLVVFGLNKLLLKQSMPKQRQVKLWDSVLVPLSRMLDPLLRYRVGKTILCVWRMPEGSNDEGPQYPARVTKNAAR